LTPKKRKSESPDDDWTTGTSTPMSRNSSLRKKSKTNYREMTDGEWYEAMQKAEKNQFKMSYSPSPSIQNSSSRSFPMIKN
jgi:hypothetical protein